MKKPIAKFIGAFTLVLIGCGSAASMSLKHKEGKLLGSYMAGGC